MNMEVADRSNLVQSPAVSKIKEKARRIETSGRNLIYLLRGEPDFDTPDHIIQSAFEAMRSGQTHYGPTKGIPELRRAIANRMARDFSLEFDPDSEILVTTGATMGIYVALQAIIEPEDEVILFDPIYDPYGSVILLAGGVPVRIPSQMDSGHFCVEGKDIEKAVTQKTKAILINNPWNPTGAVIKRDELLELVEIAESYDLVIIVDEIYEKLIYENLQHTCLASLGPEARRRTITINSFSKTYAMTGWRLGYTLAPPSFTAAMIRIAQQFSRCASTFVQFAGVSALEGEQGEVEQMINTYSRRRQYIHSRLSAIETLTPYAPEGTFFYLLDIRPLGLRSEEASDYLLNEAGVVVVPGNYYGEGGEGFLRFSFAYNEEVLDQGLDAVVDALSRI